MWFASGWQLNINKPLPLRASYKTFVLIHNQLDLYF